MPADLTWSDKIEHSSVQNPGDRWRERTEVKPVCLEQNDKSVEGQETVQASCNSGTAFWFYVNCFQKPMGILSMVGFML